MKNDRFTALIATYVSGELVGAPADELERHVATCAACAAEIARAARFELALHEIGPEAAHMLAKPRAARVNFVPWLRRGFTLAGLVAAAAVVLLFWGGRVHTPHEAAGPVATSPVEAIVEAIFVACPVEHEECLAVAHRHGVQVDYPAALTRIPRYEESFGTTHFTTEVRPMLRQARVDFD